MTRIRSINKAKLVTSTDQLSCGRKDSLVAKPDKDAVNWSIFSQTATSVETLLCKNHDDPEPTQIIKLDPNHNETFSIWHVYGIGMKELVTKFISVTGIALVSTTTLAQEVKPTYINTNWRSPSVELEESRENQTDFFISQLQAYTVETAKDSYQIGAVKSVVDRVASIVLEDGITFTTDAQQMTRGMNVLVVKRNGEYIVEDIIHPAWKKRLENNSDNNNK